MHDQVERTHMNLKLEQLNQASDQQAFEWLKGLYEHSDWVAQNALAQRPFQSLSHLKRAMIVRTQS
jgi:beta-ureidopropionase / N-carbamoyl-L-amino-acid hydrolase